MLSVVKGDAAVRLPAEWEPHARTVMGFPCRPASWGAAFAAGRAEAAAAANAIAAFEPVTVICATEADERDARPLLAAAVETVVIPMDGSWLRDNGPIYVQGPAGREARVFRFNAWGERHAQRDRDIALGRTIPERAGDPYELVDVVLEGGAIAGDGAGLLALVEECVMHPNRNWDLTRDEVEQVLMDSLGLERVVWLPRALWQDLDWDYGTDGHIDLFVDFIGARRCLMYAPEDPADRNAEIMAEGRAVLEAAGVEVVPFPHMGGFAADGRDVIAPYLNLYLCNGAAIVPVSGEDPDLDAAALAALGAALPDREIVPVAMRAAPMQGGAVHCMTQQIPHDPDDPRAASLAPRTAEEAPC